MMVMSSGTLPDLRHDARTVVTFRVCDHHWSIVIGSGALRTYSRFARGAGKDCGEVAESGAIWRTPIWGASPRRSNGYRDLRLTIKISVFLERGRIYIKGGEPALISSRMNVECESGTQISGRGSGIVIRP